SAWLGRRGGCWGRFDERLGGRHARAIGYGESTRLIEPLLLVGQVEDLLPFNVGLEYARIGTERRPAEHDKIGVLARRERADAVLQVQRLGGVQRDGPQG